MVTALGQAGHWAVEGEQMFSSAALVFLELRGCKVRYAFGGQHPKEGACSLYFGFVLLQPLLLPKFLHSSSCEWLLLL